MLIRYPEKTTTQIIIWLNSDNDLKNRQMKIGLGKGCANNGSMLDVVSIYTWLISVLYIDALALILISLEPINKTTHSTSKLNIKDWKYQNGSDN